MHNLPHTAINQVSIREAKARLAALVDGAAGGRPVVITRNGKPVAVLTAYHPDQVVPNRVGGQLRGRIWIVPNFDAPDPEFEDLFYNGPVFPPDEPA